MTRLYIPCTVCERGFVLRPSRVVPRLISPVKRFYTPPPVTVDGAA